MTASNGMDCPQRIGLLVLPGFQVMCFSAFSVFEVANQKAGKAIYDLHVLSEKGGPVPTSFGMNVSTEPIGKCDFDTLMIGVGMEIPSTPPGIVSCLKEASRTTRRLASICLGSFVLGDAGLLHKRRATTHWRFAREFQSRFPDTRVEIDRIFVADGPIWTSAGMSAGTDLALSLLESDHGRELAKRTAQGLVIHHRRAGGQSQHSALLELDAKSDRVQSVLAYAKFHLRSPLSIAELAGVACLSPRQFTRLFRAETGVSPARAVEALRIEAAKLLLEQSRLSMEEIAVETGFGARERMRRAFVRIYGEAPQAIRSEAGPVAAI
jgi:transcriptional regulator GlxA family with amidase domain